MIPIFAYSTILNLERIHHRNQTIKTINNHYLTLIAGLRNDFFLIKGKRREPPNSIVVGPLPKHELARLADDSFGLQPGRLGRRRPAAEDTPRGPGGPLGHFAEGAKVRRLRRDPICPASCGRFKVQGEWFLVNDVLRVWCWWRGLNFLRSGKTGQLLRIHMLLNDFIAFRFRLILLSKIMILDEQIWVFYDRVRFLRKLDPFCITG